MALLPDLGTEIAIPVFVVIGIAFSQVQWFLVSKVKVSPERGGASAAKNGNNGYGDYLIEEEDIINDQNAVDKCAEIQSAISEGSSQIFSSGMVLIGYAQRYEAYEYAPPLQDPNMYYGGHLRYEKLYSIKELE